MPRRVRLTPYVVAVLSAGQVASAYEPENYDSATRGAWWNKEPGTPERPRWTSFLDVPRDETIGFALYTHDGGVLKLTAQLYPLLPDETREVSLEIDTGEGFEPVGGANVIEYGWSAHFRIDNWDQSREATYRLRHGDSVLTGTIRSDPVDKDSIVVGLMSCDSNQDRRDRDDIVAMIKHHDPDVLLFVGDQVYDHTQHTAAWLLWGSRYRDVLIDRPVVTIPDDHDIGHGNLWGEGGEPARTHEGGDAGGYKSPPEYVRAVERLQTWHLPDPYDPTPVAQGIGVYYTSLTVGGVGFAILEDRKFKSAPEWRLPKMGPRYDHITDPSYDRDAIDLPGLKLLGDRQITFLNDWGENWSGQEMKAVVSQTGFCGAVHLHGKFENRLLADLDCNGWPQTARNRALRAIRRAGAVHLAGDQHLATVVQHGIDEYRDGPFAYIGPAVVNTYYQRWWWPLDEQPGNDPIEDAPLPWTGDYLDGLGNMITMHAYGNPMPIAREVRRDPTTDMTPGRYGDGLGLVRFNKIDDTITFEAWPRWTDPTDPTAKQLTGWPITIDASDNDGRQPTGYLPAIDVDTQKPFVVQVIDESTGEVLYNKRVDESSFRPPVFSDGPFTIRTGETSPTLDAATGVRPTPVE
ncbi:MAG: hypothetical protein CMJ31_02350 [Phycisphaerae bacterium]|nr:hypothetical protein [Phycisphaerae bacterium]